MEPLVQTLNTATDRGTLEACCKALARIGTDESVEVLISVIKKKRFFLLSEPKQLRICAIWALGYSANPKADKILNELIYDRDPEISNAARSALQGSG